MPSLGKVNWADVPEGLRNRSRAIAKMIERAQALLMLRAYMRGNTYKVPYSVRRDGR